MKAIAAPFDRDTLVLAFSRLGDLAVQESKLVEISVYGGSALLLTFDTRTATRDVDAVFEADRTFIREAAAKIAIEFGWDTSWINDGVKGYLSERDSEPATKRLFRSFPEAGKSGLRVFVASPQYLFAMKCLAMRIGGAESGRDIGDIRMLASSAGIRTYDEAIDIVSSYYPSARIPAKTQFGLQEIFGTGSSGIN